MKCKICLKNAGIIVSKKPTYDHMIIAQKKIHDKFILICDECVKKELKKTQKI